MLQTTGGIAFFDFDGTLIEGDCLLYFLEEIAGRRAARWAFAVAAVRALLPVTGPYGNSAVQVAGADFRTRVKILVLRRLLAGASADDCRAAGARVARRLRWNRAMLDTLDRLRAEGWSIVLATGALDVCLSALLSPIGRVDGILATEMAVTDQRLTGAMASANCVRAEKARRVKAWLEARRDDSGRTPPSIAYGNRPSDLPMMAVVDSGVIVRLPRGREEPILTPYAHR